MNNLDSNIKNSTEEIIPNDRGEEKGFFRQYGVILSILIGAWMIAMSVILAGWLIVRHLDSNQTVYGQNKLNISITESDPILGNPNAPITIYEYADFQCPFCKSFQDSVVPWLKDNYINTGKVKFVFRDFAFLGEESTNASAAAKCAKEQNKFWEYHDALYASQGQENSGAFATDKLKTFANSLGLNQEQFNQCLDSGKYTDEVNSEADEANKLGIESTPTIVIDGEVYVGIMKQAEYENVINEALDNYKASHVSILSKILNIFNTDDRK